MKSDESAPKMMEFAWTIWITQDSCSTSIECVNSEIDQGIMNIILVVVKRNISFLEETQ